MKNIILSTLLLGTLFLLSCDNDSYSFEDEKANQSDIREGDIMDKKECFELEFPVGIKFPNQKVTTAKGEDEFYAALKKWYKENPKEKEKPGLKYPVHVLFKGDIKKTISSENEMISLKKYCDDKKGGIDKDCFSMVYPLSYEMPDGVQITGENEDEVNAAMKAWYESNSSSKEKPSLLYPVDVTLKDGSTFTINNETEMIKLKKDC